jgi:Protein of unknown function (DUF3302)
MSGLDVFAWIMFLVLVVSTIAIIFIAGALPGQIARSRGHPWVQAVTVAGWVGLTTRRTHRGPPTSRDEEVTCRPRVAVRAGRANVQFQCSWTRVLWAFARGAPAGAAR